MLDSRLTGTPERVFVSVDEASGRSTLSFSPQGVGAPIQYDDDHTGERAVREAQAIAAEYPGCKVEGPHFHRSNPDRKPRFRRR